MTIHQTELPPPINHVFLDHENVHEIDLSVIGAKSVYFTLLLGARQKKLDVSLVEKLMEHASSVQIVRLNSSGKNALDFALTYCRARCSDRSDSLLPHRFEGQGLRSTHRAPEKSAPARHPPRRFFNPDIFDAAENAKAGETCASEQRRVVRSRAGALEEKPQEPTEAQENAGEPSGGLRWQERDESGCESADPEPAQSWAHQYR